MRAWQTAQIVAKIMSLPKQVEALDELRNESTTVALIRVLRSCPRDSEIFLVGHVPSMPQHIAVFIGAKETDGIALGKGGVACVELSALRAGGGQLQWLGRPKQLRLIAQ